MLPIPATATTAGVMACARNFSAIHLREFDALLLRWQAAENEKHYGVSGFTHPADQVHGTYGKTYARLDIGGSGAFMVELDTGIIYSIKGYGKVDRKKVLGNAYHPDFDAAVLVRDRFRHGRFDNTQTGEVR